MLKWFGRIWKTLVRFEEANAVITWLLPIIIGGVGMTMAAYAMQYGYIVWIAFWVSAGGFAAYRFYAASYASTFGLYGQLGIWIEQPLRHDNGVSFNFCVENHAGFPIAFRTKAKFSMDGRVYEDNNFDPPSFIGPKSTARLTAGPLSNISENAKNWTSIIVVEYGTSPDRLKYRMTFDAVTSANDVDGAYDVNRHEYEKI